MFADDGEDESKKKKKSGGLKVNHKRPFWRIWESFIALCGLASCILGVYLATFNSTMLPVWGVVFFCDLAFIIDIVLQFHVSFTDKDGIVVTEKRQIVKHYLKSRFVLDVLAVLPLDPLVMVLTSASFWKQLALLRINRLLNLYRTLSFFDGRESELGTNTVLLRSGKYFVVSLVCTHTLASGWFALACEGIHEGLMGSCQPDSWVSNPNVGFNMSTAESSSAYITAIYWTVATVTSTGYGDLYAANLQEKWFSTVAMLLGIAALFGMLLGGMTSMLTNMDIRRAKFVHRIDTIKEYMDEHLIPDDIQDQVIDYYEYLWARKKGELSDGIYGLLPTTFQMEILHATNSNILEKAPIFKGIGEGCMRMLSQNIHAVMLLPQQIVITRGQIGHQMFFIHRGEVEVLSEDDLTPIATLKSGKLFGEVSLIYSLPRTATIQAKTHCDLMVLEKDDLHVMLEHFPKVSQRLSKLAQKRCNTAEKDANKSSKGGKKGDFKAMQQRNTGYVDPTLQHRKSFTPMDQSPSESMGLHHRKNRITIHKSDSVELLGEEEHKAAGGARSLGARVREMIDFLIHTTITPTHSFCLWWQFIVISVTVIIAFAYPYMACFTAYDRRHGYFDSGVGQGFLGIGYVLDLFLFVDILINLRTEVATPHGALDDFKDIVNHYCKSVGFVFDVAAVLPIEMACFMVPAGFGRNRMFAFLRLNRVLKFLRIPMCFSRLEDSLHVSILKVRFVSFLLYIALLSHWVACSLYAVACYGTECNADSWLATWSSGRGMAVNGSAPGTEYVVSLYWAAATMTSTGYGDISAHSMIGRVFSLCAMLIGLLLYGYCLSAVAATLANLDAARVGFQERLFALKTFLKQQHLSKDIQCRVNQYMSTMWEKYKGEWMPESRPLMYDMPVSLQQDIASEDVVHTLSKCPLFTNTDVEFLRALALKVQAYLFSPGDTIIYAGDVGREMYLVHRGLCEVLQPDQGGVLAEIGPGQYFGVLGMLFGDYRLVTTRAKSHVEALQLTISDLNDVLANFPLIEAQIKRVQQDKSILKQLKEKRNKRLDKLEDGSLRTVKNENHEGALFQGKVASSTRHIGSFKKFIPGAIDHEEYVEPFAGLSIAVRILSKLLMRRTLLPQGDFLRMWTIALLCLGVIVAFTIPIQAAFLPSVIVLWVFHYLVDIVCFVNIYLGFHLAFYNEENVLVMHPLSTAKNYLRTNFLLDLLCCFPLELIALIIHPSFESYAVHIFALCRINRFLLLYRLPLAYNYLENCISTQTGTIRLRKFAFYTVIYMNAVTCLLFMMACPPGMSHDAAAVANQTAASVRMAGHICHTNNWIFNTIDNNGLNSTELSNGMMYVISLYWASATSVSVGYGDISANRDHEMIVSLIVMILGVLFFGYIVASVAASLTNADVGRARFKRKLQSIRKYMEDQHVDAAMRQRMISYYEYVFVRTKGVDRVSLFQGIPPALLGDITLGLYENMISKISLFRGVEKTFVKMLSMRVKPVIIPNGEFIVRRNDMGTEMFFISRGIVDVTSEDGSTVFDTMAAGESFGEVAMMFQIPRTASVRARTNCDMFVLTRQDLESALEYYPETREQILHIAEGRRDQAHRRSMADMTGGGRPPKMLFGDRSEVFEPKEGGASPNKNSNNPASDGSDGDASRMAKLRLKMRFVISPDARFSVIWRYLVAFLGILSFWLVSYEVAFQNHHVMIIVMNYVCDAVFLVEIYLKFHRSYPDEFGNLIEDYDVVHKNYAQNWGGLLWDVVVAVPLEVAALAAPSGLKLLVFSFLRIPHMMRVIVAMKFFENWEKELNVSMLTVRLMKNVAQLLLIIHFCAGVWYMIACPLDECVDRAWYRQASAELDNKMEAYGTSIYWAVATVTSTGYGDVHAYTILEMLFSSMVMIAGKLILGFILGDIASALANGEYQRVEYDLRLTGVKDHMLDQHVPQSLQDKVVDYYDYLWIRKKGVDIRGLFADAPSCLNAELWLGVVREMMESIPLFTNASEPFLRAISQKVDQVLILPGDFIVRKGDLGKELYYIHQGQVEVVSEDNPPVVLDRMDEGQTFGEVSVVINMPRRVSVRAKTHVDLYALSKPDLDSVLKFYPKMEEKILELAHKRFGHILEAHIKQQQEDKKNT